MFGFNAYSKAGVFDDRGRYWDYGSHALADRLGSKWTDNHTLYDYSVRNLGYVGVSACGTSARVGLRPRIVLPEAVRASRAWLLAHAINRIAIGTYESEWRHQILSVIEAIRALQDITMTKSAA